MRYFSGMHGLGDNIYQRAFIKSLVKSGEVWLETPWPEIYQDLPNLHFVKPFTRLRTQAKNLRKSDVNWEQPPSGNSIKISYADNGILRGMRRCFDADSSSFDLPKFGSPISGDYAVVRPATVRKEWAASSRNPNPAYLAECTAQVLRSGLPVISVADLDKGAEWAVEPLPDATKRFHEGELSVTQLLGLIANAKMVIGGIGWMLPAAIAYKVPGWFVFGGFGRYNNPEVLMDPSRMDISKIGYALPDHFCKCGDGNHNCDKRISNHAEKFTKWLGRFPDLVSGKGHGVPSS